VTQFVVRSAGAAYDASRLNTSLLCRACNMWQWPIWCHRKHFSWRVAHSLIAPICLGLLTRIPFIREQYAYDTAPCPDVHCDDVQAGPQGDCAVDCLASLSIGPSSHLSLEGNLPIDTPLRKWWRKAVVMYGLVYALANRPASVHQPEWPLISMMAPACEPKRRGRPCVPSYYTVGHGR
jgi:hypothetical protein